MSHCFLFLCPLTFGVQYVQTDNPSSKSLAGLVIQLLQFQEDAFGRRVNNPALTKLPVSSFILASYTFLGAFKAMQNDRMAEIQT